MLTSASPVLPAVITGGTALVGSIVGTVISPWWRQKAARRDTEADRWLNARREAYYDLHRDLAAAIDVLAGAARSLPEDLEERLRDRVEGSALMASAAVMEKARAVYHDVVTDVDSLYTSRLELDMALSPTGEEADRIEASGRQRAAIVRARGSLRELMSVMKDELGTNQ